MLKMRETVELSLCVTFSMHGVIFYETSLFVTNFGRHAEQKLIWPLFCFIDEKTMLRMKRENLQTQIQMSCANDSSLEIQFEETKNGKKRLFIDGYKFLINKKGSKHFYWRCTQYLPIG